MTGTRASSFSHEGSFYQAETRARVIIFDIVAFETDSGLLRRKTSLLSNSSDQLNRTLSKEHGSLVSWPENMVKARSHKLNPEAAVRNTNSLSTRAMQLSIYGSMV